MRFVRAVPVSRLRPFPGNPRKHGSDIDRLVKSIEHYGWTNPVLVQEKTNRIIAGHGRIEAAKKAGIKNVPCIYLSLSDQDATAYAVADNRLAELSEWDLPKLKDLLGELDGAGFDSELTGFTDAEIDTMLQTEPDAVSAGPLLQEHYQILVMCRSESEQTMLLQRFSEEGLQCRALLS
jgi:ParB-like chromosome segregation protein Spo0J